MERAAEGRSKKVSTKQYIGVDMSYVAVLVAPLGTGALAYTVVNSNPAYLLQSFRQIP